MGNSSEVGETSIMIIGCRTAIVAGSWGDLVLFCCKTVIADSRTVTLSYM
jgi:hypothetical protein